MRKQVKHNLIPDDVLRDLTLLGDYQGRQDAGKLKDTTRGGARGKHTGMCYTADGYEQFAVRSSPFPRAWDLHVQYGHCFVDCLLL